MTRTALIIEDEILIAFELEDILASLDFSVIGTCTTEEQAVEAALRSKPDLLVVDYRLAQGNGVDAVKRIGESLNARVVFVTANTDELRRRVSDAVCVDKPFNRETVERAIRTAFAGRSNGPGPAGGAPAGELRPKTMSPGKDPGDTPQSSRGRNFTAPPPVSLRSRSTFSMLRDGRF